MLWLLLYFYSSIERFPEYDGYLCLVENIALTLCYGCNLFVQFLLRGNFNCCQPPESLKGTNQDKNYRCLSRKFKLGRNEKIASPRMKIYTETTMFANIRKSSVFFSYNWSPVAKNEEVFDKFYAYMGDHRKLYPKHRLCAKIY